MNEYDWRQAGSADGLRPGPGGMSPPSRRPDTGGKERSGLGGLWLLLAPLACCGGPLLIAALGVAGALAWGGIGLAAVVLLAVAVLVIRRRRRACPPACAADPPPRAETAPPRTATR
jgi:hypothetical protein